MLTKAGAREMLGAATIGVHGERNSRCDDAIKSIAFAGGLCTRPKVISLDINGSTCAGEQRHVSVRRPLFDSGFSTGSVGCTERLRKLHRHSSARSASVGRYRRSASTSSIIRLCRRPTRRRDSSSRSALPNCRVSS